MKDKNLAGVLALIFGSLGVHRFYLGQIGLGILYLFFFWISWFIGIIDAIIFFSMDQDEFDRKYNKGLYEERAFGRYDQRDTRQYEREKRRAEREAWREEHRRRERTGQRPAPAVVRPTRSAAAPYRSAGIERFKDYDYDGAIEAFEKALQADPRDIASHFNLACTYSLTENKDKAFYHLDRAVALGFDEWNLIKTKDALAFLRIQPEFPSFEQNGFRLAPQLESPREDLLGSLPQETPQAQPATGDLLDQLQRLGDLRDKGLLTDEEFAAQKRKLLG